MQQKQMRITLLIGLIYAAVSMYAMLVAAMNRIVIIEDGGQQEMLSGANGMERTDGNSAWRDLLAKAEPDRKEDIVIPLEEDTKAEDVTIENHYMDQEIWISISGIEKYFYTKNEIGGNLSLVETALYERDGGTVWMKFKLNGIYELTSVLEEHCLCIEMAKPTEMYEHIIVVDPWYGGKDAGGKELGTLEEQITLDIAKRMEGKMRSEDEVKLYYTSMGEGMPSLEERIQIIEETAADFYVGITVNQTDDTTVYGLEAVYNDTYFIPRAGSIELADTLVRNATIAVSGRAVGLTQAQEADRIIQSASIPAAVIKVGYLSNEKEASLLNEEDYRDRLADGICNAIKDFYETTENADERKTGDD